MRRYDRLILILIRISIIGREARVELIVHAAKVGVVVEVSHVVHVGSRIGVGEHSLSRFRYSISTSSSRNRRKINEVVVRNVRLKHCRFLRNELEVELNDNEY